MNETQTKPDGPLGAMTGERALKWLDETLEELGHALEACDSSGVEPAVVQGKINGFIVALMSRTPDLAAHAAASAGGAT